MLVYKTKLNTEGFCASSSFMNGKYIRDSFGNNIVNNDEIVIDATYLYTEKPNDSF